MISIVTKKLKGFTIIELLVAVAIVAVLSTIVLFNVVQYGNKGKNAAINGNLSTMITNAAIYVDANGNYTGFCTTSGYTNPETEVNSITGGTMVKNCAAATFCACVPLKGTTDTLCVDYTGYKKETPTACSSRCSTTVTSCAD
ncbi:MAG: type II secretion system protein [Patescibacteria group bacterium]